MEIKFTKGEWQLSLDCGGKTLIYSDNEVICEGFMCSHDKVETDSHRIEAKANANLVAAAPEMYKNIEEDIEILKRQARNLVLGSHELRSVTLRIKSKAKLLAKARGEL